MLLIQVRCEALKAAETVFCFKAFLVLEIQELTRVNGCLQHKHEAENFTLYADTN